MKTIFKTTIFFVLSLTIGFLQTSHSITNVDYLGNRSPIYTDIYGLAIASSTKSKVNFNNMIFKKKQYNFNLLNNNFPADENRN